MLSQSGVKPKGSKHSFTVSGIKHSLGPGLAHLNGQLGRQLLLSSHRFRNFGLLWV